MVAAAVAPVAPVAAPVAVSSPPPPDDGWDEEPTRVEDDELPTGMLQAAKALPAVSHHRAEPRADLRDHQATPAPSQDPRPIVKAAVDEAVTPLLRMVLDLQRRIEQLEQRPAAAAAAAPPTAAPPKQVDPWASAMARPVSSPPPAMPAPAPPPAPARAPVARSPWALPEGPTGPTLDVAQINRDVPLDFDMPFDGARRRRRMAIGCVMVFVLSLGGLLAILVSSYMR